MSHAVTRPRASAPWYTVFPAYNTALRRREATWGIVFALPWLLGLVIFVVGPMLSSLYLSFTKYDVVSPAQWLGITNYIRAFTEDELFWPSLSRTFRYALVVVPVGTAGS